MRGKDILHFRFLRSAGITPAYAGKRAVSGISLALTWDHPRLCGEKKLTFENYREIEGSPPPMRGKAVNAYVTFLHVGITPAYAGKSRRRNRRNI